MNTQTHRIIFNKARGCLMAVGEHARTCGGRKSSVARRKRKCATSAPQAQASAPAAAASNAKPASIRMAIHTMVPNTQIPEARLYRQHPEAGAKYLVETDPQFTQYRTWLGSDFMTAQLQFDPATTQKRLGDGFYEQKLVREQIQALTGQRFLADFNNEDAQFMALMNSGLTHASALGLRPGIALSPDQIAQLTSDMVWLVTQEVTLPDGSKQSVLSPQVYTRVQPGDLDGSGALLAGSNVQLNLSGDLNNKGTIAGRKLVQIDADNIQNLGGNISAAAVALTATQDINNFAGLINTQTAALLSAGRDINLSSSTQSSTNTAGNNTFSQTGIDRVAGLYVSGPAGVLIASAGRDITLTAAQVSNAGTGLTQLSAGRDLNLASVSTESRQDLNWNTTNHLRQSTSQDVGSQISGGGAVTISAQKDVDLRAANVNAQGALDVKATKGSVNIEAGQSTQSLDEGRQVNSKGALSSTTTTTRSTSASTTAVGSDLGGQTVVSCPSVRSTFGVGFQPLFF
jgi:filamentous hemagglutinin